MPSAQILSAATAVPPYEYAQAEIKAACVPAFGKVLASPRRLEVFDRAGVASRRLVRPKEFYFAGHDFQTRNAEYLEHALRLAGDCIPRALDAAGLKPEDVGHIISVTTTGLLTPSLEARLVHALPFSKSVKRTPLFGVGCAGGAVALARAYDFAAGNDGVTVVLSVELCSLTFLPSDRSMTQVIAAALFGDGAAAVVVAGGPPRKNARAEILAAESLILPDSLDIMGWDFTNEGMRLVLSPSAPAVIERHFRQAVDDFLARNGAKISDLGAVLLHPGSEKILQSCERALDLGPGAAERSRRFLKENGNLSSASLLFILRDALENDPPKPGSLALMAAFGPGFSCEMLLLKFS